MNTLGLCRVQLLMINTYISIDTRFCKILHLIFIFGVPPEVASLVQQKSESDSAILRRMSMTIYNTPIFSNQCISQIIL